MHNVIICKMFFFFFFSGDFHVVDYMECPKIRRRHKKSRVVRQIQNHICLSHLVNEKEGDAGPVQNEHDDQNDHVTSIVQLKNRCFKCEQFEGIDYFFACEGFAISCLGTWAGLICFFDDSWVCEQITL